MDELITWLRAQIDDDERIARATNSQPGQRYSWEVRERSPRDLPEIYLKGEHFRVVDELDDESAAHIARHDPARVLREVEAKRRLLHDFGGFFGLDDFPRGLVEYAFKLVALPYSDRPGYREEWKP